MKNNSNKKNFDIPKIIGALTDNMNNIPTKVKNTINKCSINTNFLPFQIESKFIKNTVDCMKLTDMHSLWISEPFRTKIAKKLENLDKVATISGCVDCVIREKKNFFGLDMLGNAIASWADSHKTEDKTYRTIGKIPNLKSIKAGLESYGWTASKSDFSTLIVAGQINEGEKEKLKKMAAKLQLFVSTWEKNYTKLPSNISKLNQRQFMDIFHRMSVEVLTS